MRILFGIKSLAVCRGGAERVLSDICISMVDKGYDIAIVTFDYPEDEFLYPLDDRIKLFKLGVGNPAAKTSIVDFISRIVSIRKVVAKYKPDVVVGFMSSIFVLFAFAMLGARVPLISSEHIVPQHYRDRKLEYLLLLIAGFLSVKVTVVSEKVKLLYPKVLQNKIIAIANPVSLKINEDNKEVSFNRKTILNVGRLTAQKDQSTLIKAFVLIHQDFPVWKLKIVGEGDLRYELSKLVIEHGLRDSVQFLGSIADMVPIYGDATLVAVSSTYESFGLVTAEAMASGVPVVGFSDCPGTNELIIDEVNGLLVDGDSRVVSLANGLRRLIEDKQLYDKLRRNTKSSVDKFSLVSVVSEWENLLLKVIEN